MIKKYEVIQEEISDCGICCLLSIIKYYGGFVPLENLRILTNTSSNGTNAYELIKCAKKIGFNAFGKKEVNIKNIKTPVIAHLKLNNGLYHFVVVYNIKNNKVLIMDPAKGMYNISLENFNKLYNGVILIFKPINTLPKYKKSKFIEHKVKEEIVNNNKKYFMLILINSLILVVSLILSLQYKLLSFNNKYVILLLFLILINEVFLLFKNKLILSLTINFNENLIKSFISHIFKLPSKYLKLKQDGEIVTRFNELNSLTSNFTNILIDLIFTFILVFFIFIVISFININILFFSLLFLLIFILYNFNKSKILTNDIRYSINMEESYNSNIIDYISNLNTIKNLNKYDYFSNNIMDNLKEKNKIFSIISKEIYKINFYNNIVINLFVLVSLYTILKNNFSDALSIYILINYLILNIKKIVDYLPSLIIFKSFINKNNDFLSIKYNYSKKNVANFKCLQIQNLEYVINNNKIFNNINFKFFNKDKIFIKGPSGIGKSSLMKIIVKEDDNYFGKILINNIDIKNIDVSNIITYTSQDEKLFNDTIINNICLGENINNIILENILRICRINEIQIVKDIGMNSYIINNSNISGGERNRIILARSLIHSKQVIILDEVLKEVDYVLEKNIIKDLLEYFESKTIIYISHKDLSNYFNKCFNFEERSN